MSAFIEKLLYEKIGMDIQSIGQRNFQRVLTQQLQKFDCDLAHYTLLLQQSEQIWLSLVEAIVIPETWFFRYPESFSLLEELVRRRQQGGLGQSKLHILCLPCSTGEEAYSIAITLLKCGLTAEQFCIDAIDINSQVLQQAQAGLFRQYSFRSNNFEAIEAFFQHSAAQYQLKQEVIACVNLRYGNLFEPATLPTKHYDMVFCRNLLIYFDQKTQNIAVAQLKKMLSKEGVLFSGPAEVGAFTRACMTQLARRDCFAFTHSVVKTAASRPLVAAGLPVNAGLDKATGRSSKAAVTAKLPRVVRAANTAGPKPSPVRVVPAHAGKDILHRIEQYSNAGKLDDALGLCQQALSEQGPSAQLFYLWGLLSDSLGNKNNAELYYRKALYLQPLHGAALRQLAALLHAQGHAAAAALLEQRIKANKT